MENKVLASQRLRVFDILGDGSMDMPDGILKQLDIVLATIHSRMNMPRNEMTARILKALNNPYVKILGHPTGRQLLRRDPYQFDIDLRLTC